VYQIELIALLLNNVTLLIQLCVQMELVKPVLKSANQYLDVLLGSLCVLKENVEDN
jgi:hypothetical protein